MRFIRFLGRGVVLSFLSLSLLSIPGGGCGSGGGGGGGSSGTTTLGGTVALSDGTVGTLTVTLQTNLASNAHFSLIREAAAQTSGTVSASCICVTPTCTISSDTGTYDPSTGAVSISATGGTGSGCSSTTTTTFEGTVTPPTSGSGGGMSGTISSTPTSGGTPTPVGGFSGVFTTSSTAAEVYCGIAVGGDTDAFNVNVDADGNLTGTAQPLSASSTDKTVSFSGKVTGTTFTACSDDPNGSKPICGTISADGTIDGRFTRGSDGADGCFVGDPTVCTTGTLPAPCAGATAVCTYPTCP